MVKDKNLWIFRIFEIVVGFIVIIWFFVSAEPHLNNVLLTLNEQWALIFMEPFTYVALALVIAVGVVYLVAIIKGIISAITFQELKKGLLLGALWFLIVIGIGIGVIMIFPGGWYFNDFALKIEMMTGPNPIMGYFLGSGFYTVSVMEPLLLPSILDISPGLGAILGSEIVPALLTWGISGVICGYLGKKGKNIIIGGFFLLLFMGIFVILGSRLMIMPQSFMDDLSYLVIGGVMVVNLVISAFPLMIGSLLGYQIYVHFRQSKNAPPEIPKGEGDMIECLNADKKVEGYIDGKQYLNKRKKLIGYLDGKTAKDEDGYSLLVLKDNGIITYNEESGYEEKGYLKENKIYWKSDEPIYEFLKEKGQIVDEFGRPKLYLEGNNKQLSELDTTDFFGIAAVMLELFS